MPDHCSVPGCRSGYERKHEEKAKVSFHKFPDDFEKRRKWVRAIQRDESNWKPSSQSRVCSLHFREEDYVESRDTNAARRKKRESIRCRWSLRKEAVPSVLPSLPKYLTATPSFRETAATSSGCRARQEKALEDKVAAFSEADQGVSLTKLKEKLGRDFSHKMPRKRTGRYKKSFLSSTRQRRKNIKRLKDKKAREAFLKSQPSTEEVNFI